MFTETTRDQQRRKLFVKVVNASSDAAPLNIELDGILSIAHEAKLMVLSGKSPNATNSIASPHAVIPVEQRIQIAGPKFEHGFAPYSIWQRRAFRQL
jgi:alpha-L-arabinofuranosidase